LALYSERQVTIRKLRFMTYQLLQKTNDLEVRLYPPKKRTIVVAGRYYFVQFPQLLVTKIHLAHMPGGYFNPDDSVGDAKVCLAMHFLHEGKVYKVPLYQVNHVLEGWAACLVDRKSHGFFSPDTPFEHMFHLVWTSAFQHGTFNHWGYHDWAKRDLEQVNENIPHLPCVGTYEQYLAEIKSVQERIKKGYRQ